MVDHANRGEFVSVLYLMASIQRAVISLCLEEVLGSLSNGTTLLPIGLQARSHPSEKMD
jgi:hypothetical protein